MDITSSQTMQQCVIFLYNRSLLLTNILLKCVVTGPGMYDEPSMYVFTYNQSMFLNVL
jgi:hypothetical protein